MTRMRKINSNDNNKSIQHNEKNEKKMKIMTTMRKINNNKMAVSVNGSPIL